MRYLLRDVLLTGFSVLWLGCAGSRPPAVGTTRAGDYNGFAEDLSAVRPAYTPAPRPAVVGTRPPGRSPAEVRKPATGPAPAPRPAEALHVTKRLDLVLDTIAQRNWAVRYAAGYRVQVYVGNERREADAAKLLLYQNFPELSLYLTFQQPAYKLKVGDFMRRLDAERYFASIRQLFPSARLQPDRVDVRRSLLIK
jgi:hypothetical protein